MKGKKKESERRSKIVLERVGKGEGVGERKRRKIE